jgi:hypothetical protein
MNMLRVKKTVVCFYMVLIFVSCVARGEQDLFTVIVDMQNTTVPLSGIAKEVREVELEVTDNSLIKMIRRVLWDEDHIIVLDMSEIFLFDNDGKFIRKIGSKGQGPGEYIRIIDLAADFKSKRVYVSDTRKKILCYDFDGNYLEEYSGTGFIADYVNFINGELMMIKEELKNEGAGRIFHSVLYKANKHSQITDSIDIRKVVNPLAIFSKPWSDFILSDGKKINVYYPEFNTEPSLRDTVFRVEDNVLVPDFRLDFQHSGIGSDGERDIDLHNIWRSSRFIFSVYLTDGYELFHFYYDTENQKGASTKDGYYDDLYAGKNVNIRPMNLNPEQFYYTYTKDDEALEEPNPTLCIGTLKK